MSDLLRCEERIKNTFYHVRWNTAAGVRHGHDSIFTHRNFIVLIRYFAVHRFVVAFNRQHPTSQHGIASVDRKIERGVVELTWIGHHQPEAGLEVRLDLNLLADRTTQQRQQVFQQSIEGDDLGLQRLPPCKRKQAMYEIGSCQCRSDSIVQLCDRRLQLLIHDVKIVDDDVENVVEIMRHTAGQLTNSLHLL